MTSNQEKAAQLLADLHFAFINSQNSEALRLASEAMRLASKNPDAYQCAGNAYMSLGQYDKAVESYRRRSSLIRIMHSYIISYVKKLKENRQWLS